MRSAYGANYERLMALKNACDPTNFFRLNQNVQPSAYSSRSRPDRAVYSGRCSGE
jgi:hypothetical protein